jgi:hypothetical protein
MGINYKIMMAGTVEGSGVKVMLRPEEIDISARPVIQIKNDFFYFDHLSDVQKIFTDISIALKRKKYTEKTTLVLDQDERFVDFIYTTDGDMCYLTFDEIVVEVTGSSLLAFNAKLNKEVKSFYDNFDKLSIRHDDEDEYGYGDDY